MIAKYIRGGKRCLAWSKQIIPYLLGFPNNPNMMFPNQVVGEIEERHAIHEPLYDIGK